MTASAERKGTHTWVSASAGMLMVVCEMLRQMGWMLDCDMPHMASICLRC